MDTVEDILPAVLARLRTRGVVIDDLSTGTVSWMGVARLPDSRERLAPTTTDGTEGDGAVAVVTPKRLHRRMDIKTYTPDEMPFALLYFTGSGYFNRSMRTWADKAKLEGIVAAVKSSEQAKARYRGALEKIQAILADALDD